MYGIGRHGVRCAPKSRTVDAPAWDVEYIAGLEYLMQGKRGQYSYVLPYKT